MTSLDQQFRNLLAFVEHHQRPHLTKDQVEAAVARIDTELHRLGFSETQRIAISDLWGLRAQLLRDINRRGLDA